MFAPFARTLATALPRPVLALRRLVDRAIPDEHRNTRHGARANIEAHYDLSNDLFAAFLDPSLSYSSALFDPERPFAEQDLEAAQHRKIDRILDAAEVGDGCRLLEIGSGWGELAIRAAQRGADVTSITLSAQQQRLATERIARAGLQHRARVELLDYRDVTREFDAVVSVEMIEAVGEDYWVDYFTAIDRALAPGGALVIQSILMDHRRLQATRRSYGWIQKHIFPGGLIPSTTALQEAAREGSTLELVDVFPFGAHYGETLLRWRTRFDERWPHISTLGFDEAFRRTWRFYLAYCQAGFDTGYLDVAHLTLRRPR
ncbi:SAM-dependent methyltransferase [Arsenicicoccus piscis]|uniref:SAM-dependent methyltransferase n=1 Tax=Arsenicicoccus piscis TaxID=673954 RepID=A0ABQ6HV12_9MICO|nr:cyclopropane-fatty-acyl-phospholipid synthase family protein [Arsenicicoccus piscis]GMA21812.1 hypothetical protein GCM10025862_38330 [Arsenicicoccus piscis]